MDSAGTNFDDLFDDSDAFTQDIYHPGPRVRKVIKTDTARAFVDVSRSPNMMPPEYPDGVIKSATCYNRPIYKNGRHPAGVLVQQLLAQYYHPYHQKIIDAIQSPDIVLAFDCHSMAAVAPAISPDPGRKRPLINLGDAHGKACDSTMTNIFKTAFIKVFNCHDKDVTINEPFAGGYITQQYGNNPVPWIQIEMNRKLYLAEPWFHKASLKMDKRRLYFLNKQFVKVLEQFYFYCTDNNLF